MSSVFTDIFGSHHFAHFLDNGKEKDSDSALADLENIDDDTDSLGIAFVSKFRE